MWLKCFTVYGNQLLKRITTHVMISDMLNYLSCTFVFSFVVGSDGYVYEGRGWNHVGRHTRGHNALGYGVSIIGNYTATLPSRHAMDLLRNHLALCAVNGGGLTGNYTIQGHRQVVNYTSCPGDSLFSEIRSWEHFRGWHKIPKSNFDLWCSLINVNWLIYPTKKLQLRPMWLLSDFVKQIN